MIYNKVYLFLHSLNLAHYWDTFTAKGYDREDDIVNLDDNDLDILFIAEKDRGPLLRAGKINALPLVTIYNVNQLLYTYFF